MLNSVHLRARALIVGCGLVVSATALWHQAPSARRYPVEPSHQRAVFDALVSDESARWATSVDDWAHHRWSQRDAFGALERERVRTLSVSEGVSPQAVFRALDDGLRAKWRGPHGETIDATTTPLKPRPMD